jgi:hypothetical protein
MERYTLWSMAAEYENREIQMLEELARMGYTFDGSVKALLSMWNNHKSAKMCYRLYGQFIGRYGRCEIMDTTDLD